MFGEQWGFGEQRASKEGHGETMVDLESSYRLRHLDFQPEATGSFCRLH